VSDELKEKGFTLLPEAQTEPWGQTVASFSQRGGRSIGLSYVPQCIRSTTEWPPDRRRFRADYPVCATHQLILTTIHALADLGFPSYRETSP